MKSFTFKLTIFLLIVNFNPAQTLAQGNDSLLVQLSRKWSNAKVYTLKMADLMPAGDFQFKPTPDQMSFGEQLLHIANNILMLSSTTLSSPSGLNFKNVDPSDKIAVIDAVSKAYNVGLYAHNTLRAVQLDIMVEFFAGPLSKRQLLILMHDHQTHHVGQLIVYLRLRGVKPVSYVGW